MTFKIVFDGNSARRNLGENREEKGISQRTIPIYTQYNK